MPFERSLEGLIVNDRKDPNFIILYFFKRCVASYPTMIIAKQNTARDLIDWFIET